MKGTLYLKEILKIEPSSFPFKDPFGGVCSRDPLFIHIQKEMYHFVLLLPIQYDKPII